MQVDVPFLPYQLFTAGDLSVMYEAGNLRYVKFGEIEILRMVYGALRNENWDTIIPKISNESVVTSEAGTTITYEAAYNFADISYEAEFEISIDVHNTIRFLMKGTALSNFKKNRIGICVLHPVKECSGKKITISVPGGDSYESIFPDLISAHQPFTKVNRMQWSPAEGLLADLQLSGDIYETEDQRNWGDDSFKTYSTPLSLAFPVMVTRGDQLLQEVVLTVTGAPVSAKHSDKNTKELPLPVFRGAIGYFKLGNALSLNRQQEATYRQFSFQHQRLELQLFEEGWEQVAESNIRSIIGGGLKPELILFFNENYIAQLSAFRLFLEPFSTEIYSILLLDSRFKVTPASLMQQGYEQIKTSFPNLCVGYGTDAWFTELNRNPPGGLLHDFVSFCISPQVHATDTRTVIENLRTLPHIIKSARSLTNKPIHISPLSVHKRKNPDAISTKELEGTIGTYIQYTSFAAEWILMALPQLAGAASITIPY